MSEEHELGTLVTGMMNTMGELRKVIAAQREMLVNQQQTLAGIAALLKVHGNGLGMHQRVIEAMAGQLGIAFDPLPEEPQYNPPGPVN